MKSDTKLRRDPFAFSLRGIGVANSYAVVPAIADNGFSKTRDARLRQPPGPSERGEPRLTRRVEAVLARYFAHSYCTATN
jgi:hypothetical protein